MATQIIDISQLCNVISGTFSQLSELLNTSSLVAGKKYLMTDYQTIYDQIGTEVTKTGVTEQIILTSISSNQFDFRVVSLSNPKDVIHYDISINQTTINNAPTKGRIIYREDENGNSAGYDWRAVLNYDGANETLTFVGTISALNNISGYLIESGITDQEFPNVIFKGLTGRNKDNYFLNTIFEYDFLFNSNCSIEESTFNDDFFINSNCSIEESTFNGRFSQNSNTNLENCVNMGFVEGNKGCNFDNLDGLNINANNNINVNNVNVDILNCNNMNIGTIDVQDCPQILECSGINYNTGFTNLIISSDGNESFKNNLFLTQIDGNNLSNSINITDYPELFQLTSCTIYRSSQGLYYYEYRDSSNVLQTKQII